MTYDFKNLSPADFEELVAELIGRELDLWFETFTSGPDGGIDGRHVRAGRATILQAKRYASSSFASLMQEIKRERPSIDRLAPSRYILATARRLTPRNKQALAKEIGPWLLNQSDIYGPNELNSLLRKHPNIEKAHIKLWLSSVAVLDKLLHAAADTFNRITREEIEDKVRVYAPNPSFTESRSILEKQHVLIVSGPPGVGKTTLAEMLAYAYLGDDWQLVAIRSLDDGFSSINDTEKQVFLFDDFLGKIALDVQSLAAKDSDLSRFIKRIRSSPNARFILTTRAYIFEEALRVSEHLADSRLDISKYVLDVGIYTRRIRARILYNHLLVAGTPHSHVRALIQSGKLAAVVDHKNYNPRVIEWMTDGDRLANVTPDNYADEFLAALANPIRLWDTAFRTHISAKCRHLLITMYFLSEYGVELHELEETYDVVHETFCMKYGHSRDPKDFDEAIRILEGGFLLVRGRTASYINPSLRDYLKGYVSDSKMLRNLARCARKAGWAQNIWRFAQQLKLNSDNRLIITGYFRPVAEQFHLLPSWARVAQENSYHVVDISMSDRLTLLLEWWKEDGDDHFARCALRVAKTATKFDIATGFDSWRDGTELVELLEGLSEDDAYKSLPGRADIAEEISVGLCGLLERGMSSDDLYSVVEAIQTADGKSGIIPQRVHRAAKRAVRDEFALIDTNIEAIESEAELGEHIANLEKLAPAIGLSQTDLERAVTTVRDRIAELSESVSASNGPSVSNPSRESDKFDDAELANLFLPLLHNQ